MPPAAGHVREALAEVPVEDDLAVPRHQVELVAEAGAVGGCDEHELGVAVPGDVVGPQERRQAGVCREEPPKSEHPTSPLATPDEVPFLYPGGGRMVGAPAGALAGGRLLLYDAGDRAERAGRHDALAGEARVDKPVAIGGCKSGKQGRSAGPRSRRLPKGRARPRLGCPSVRGPRRSARADESEDNPEDGGGRDDG